MAAKEVLFPILPPLSTINPSLLIVGKCKELRRVWGKKDTETLDLSWRKEVKEFYDNAFLSSKMIHLSNGHSFEYMAASGALAYDGRGWPWERPLHLLGLLDPKLFTVVTKTLTEQPRQGNLRWSHPWPCVKHLPSGVVNAVGLTNPGLGWWLKKVGPGIAGRGIPLICSITHDDPEILATMAASLNDMPVLGIELNASCPNTQDEISRNAEIILQSVKAIKGRSRHPLIRKLSVNQDYLNLARQTEGLVEALSINSVPWRIACPGQERPLQSLGGGGVSGKAAHEFTWKMVKELCGAVKTPVIGPGIWEYEDLSHLRGLGAKALSFGSIFLRYPWRAPAFVRRDMKRTDSLDASS